MEEKVWTVKGMLERIKEVQAVFPKATLEVYVSGVFNEMHTTHVLDRAPFHGTDKLGRRISLLLGLPATYYHENRRRVDVPARTIEVLPAFGHRFTVHIDVIHPEFSTEDGWE